MTEPIERRYRCELGHEAVYEGDPPERCGVFRVESREECGAGVTTLVSLVPRDPFRPDDVEDPIVLSRAVRPEVAYEEQHPMTGAELLQLLRGLSEEDLALPVYSEGCDCTGPALGIDAGPDGITVARTLPGITPESGGLR